MFIEILYNMAYYQEISPSDFRPRKKELVLVASAVGIVCLLGLGLGLGFFIGVKADTPFVPPSPSRLGKFKTAAVSSDGVPCSKIGRYWLRITIILLACGSPLRFFRTGFFLRKLEKIRNKTPDKLIPHVPSCPTSKQSIFYRDVLAEGGNAVDAAIATTVCIGAVNPQSAGIGGGFLMTIYDPVRRIARCLDAREVAPIAATEDMFKGNSTISQRGHFLSNKKPKTCEEV